MAKINHRRFKRTRMDRAQFKRNQQKLWSIRMNKGLQHVPEFSKKVKSQLSVLDPKVNFCLCLYQMSKK